MKKQLLLYLVLISSFFSAYSQPLDLQWMVWNNLGKRGTNSAGNQNIYYYILDKPEYTLHQISHPNLAVSVNARNDLFIIYEDGSHFNSRYSANPGPFYPSDPSDLSDVIHNFKATSGSKIEYMYLTNRYEVDDLPPRVKITSGNSGTNSPPYESNTTDYGGRLLAANHDVVFNKDITLIINLDSLKKYAEHKPINLTFDGIEEIATGVIDDDMFIFDMEPVFEGIAPNSYEAYLPHGSFTVGPVPGQIELNVETGGFAYFNLRPNELAEDYGPDGEGNAQYNAIFSIRKGDGTVVDQIGEPILHSHDPNFIRVDSICLGTDDYYVIFYHLEFENVSEMAAGNLKASVIFPKGSYMLCLEAIKWFANGEASGYVESEGRKAVFNFTENAPISRCSATNDSICKGYVEFKIKVKKSVLEVSNIKKSIALKLPIVYFDGIPFPINSFYDLLEHKTNTIGVSYGLRRKIISADCSDCVVLRLSRIPPTIR